VLVLSGFMKGGEDGKRVVEIFPSAPSILLTILKHNYLVGLQILSEDVQ